MVPCACLQVEAELDAAQEVVAAVERKRAELQAQLRGQQEALDASSRLAPEVGTRCVHLFAFA